MAFAFIHIPKTAGTSVKRQLLDDPKMRLLNVSNQKMFETRYKGAVADLKRDMQTHDALAGHIVYRPWWVDVPDCLVSVVRDPVSRAVSLTNFILDTPENGMHGVLKESGFKTAFAESDQFHNLVSNSQFRCLFGKAAEDALDRDDANDGDIATALGRHRYLLGHFADFAAFCSAMNDRFDTQLDADVTRKTRDKAQDYVFDDEDIEALRQANWADTLLFEHVRKRTVVQT
jgi:hypothetical protein